MAPDDVSGAPVPDHGLDQAEAIDEAPSPASASSEICARVVGRGRQVGDPHPLELQAARRGGLGRGGRGLAGSLGGWSYGSSATSRSGPRAPVGATGGPSGTPGARLPSRPGRPRRAVVGQRVDGEWTGNGQAAGPTGRDRNRIGLWPRREGSTRMEQGSAAEEPVAGRWKPVKKTTLPRARSGADPTLSRPPPLASLNRWSARTLIGASTGGHGVPRRSSSRGRRCRGLAVRDLVREVRAQHESDDVVHLRSGLDDAVPPAILAERLARKLERAEVPPAVRGVDARGERERGVTTTPASVVVAVPLPATTGAAEELSVRGRTRGHGQGSRPPCATTESYHYINWPHTEVRTRGLHNCCLSAWHRVETIH